MVAVKGSRGIGFASVRALGDMVGSQPHKGVGTCLRFSHHAVSACARLVTRPFVGCAAHLVAHGGWVGAMGGWVIG